MNAQALAIPAVSNSLCAAHFAIIDRLHQAQGDALDVLGLGPRECAFRVISSGPNWRLRAYGGPDAAPLLLMLPAPIKRPYIWDLTPSVSAVRYCLHQGFRVHLLEWIPPSSDGSAGLDAYGGRAIAACVATISKQANRVQPFLMGHSLGGTLAAIYCALEPRSVKGLVLLGAPLCFEPASSRFRDALVALVPEEFSGTKVVAGSLLSRICAAASPNTFVQDGWTLLSAWPTMPPWTFTPALSVGRSTRSRFRASWSIGLPSGFVARIASVTGS
jgi:polyhydroxyalkanoate synthase subunit PhaC